MGRRKTIGIKTLSREDYNAYYRAVNRRKRERDRSNLSVGLPDTKKICTKCSKLLPRNEDFFYRIKSRVGRILFSSWCRPCTNAHNISRKFGIPLERYKGMRGQHCDICWSGGRMYIDHCHKTHVIRGILCLNCNTALGKMKDNPDLLRRAAEYLEDRS